MTRKQDTTTAHEDSAALTELDLADMDTVRGGCQNCSGANGASSSTSQFTALLPLLANQNRARR